MICHAVELILLAIVTLNAAEEPPVGGYPEDTPGGPCVSDLDCWPWPNTECRPWPVQGNRKTWRYGERDVLEPSAGSRCQDKGLVLEGVAICWMPRMCRKGEVCKASGDPDYGICMNESDPLFTTRGNYCAGTSDCKWFLLEKCSDKGECVKRFKS